MRVRSRIVALVVVIGSIGLVGTPPASAQAGGTDALFASYIWFTNEPGPHYARVEAVGGSTGVEVEVSLCTVAQRVDVIGYWGGWVADCETTTATEPELTLPSDTEPGRLTASTVAGVLDLTFTGTRQDPAICSGGYMLAFASGPNALFVDGVDGTVGAEPVEQMGCGVAGGEGTTFYTGP